MDIFSKSPMQKVDGSNFNLSHSNKLSYDIGELVPTMVMECLPGDIINMDIEAMVRLAPMVAPVMHRMDIYHHAFFVPNRILWEDWDDWITGKTEVSLPHIGLGSPTTLNPGTIADYLGYKNTPAGSNQNAFAIGAYAMIYDEYYRAQYIETTEKFTPLTASSNTWAFNLAKAKPLRRAWEHDYFTSALPFPQVGDAVTLPLTNTESVYVELEGNPLNPQQVVNNAGALATNANLGSDGSGRLYDSNLSNQVYIDPNDTLFVDLAAEAVDINTLREALALQRYLEKEARGGSRYAEHLAAFFGINYSDKRLQRPEYVGGAKQNVVISEVLTTGETASNPVGSMQGHGISVGKGSRFNYKVEEYGTLMVITSIRPKTAYYQGLDKMFTRRDRYDYGNPMFANLGEQEVKVSEIYAGVATPGELDETFGYVPRYAEYKYKPSRVAGDFRDTLEFWHMGRKFTSKPVLNETFIHCEHDNRIFADTGPDDKIWSEMYFNMQVYRKLPKYGIPSIV